MAEDEIEDMHDGNEEQEPQHNPFEKADLDDKIIPLNGLYENWFLDYASYVILERAASMNARVPSAWPARRRRGTSSRTTGSIPRATASTTSSTATSTA